MNDVDGSPAFSPISAVEINPRKTPLAEQGRVEIPAKGEAYIANLGAGVRLVSGTFRRVQSRAGRTQREGGAPRRQPNCSRSWGIPTSGALFAT